MKLKIGLDLDGVIIDHTVNKIKLAKQHGYFLKPVETSSEIMKKLIPLDIYHSIQDCLYEKEGLTSKQMKDSKKILTTITKLFSTLHIISRRGINNNQRKFALQWLKNNKIIDLLGRKKILFVKSDIGKNNICKKLGINVYLDDKIKVLDCLPSVKYKVLFDPYGHYYKNPPKGIRVIKTWPKFYRYLQKLGKL